jgi:hypothetical protein
MLIKNAIITALATCALIVGVAVSVAIYRQDFSVKSVLEYIWGISFVFALAGFLLRGGAATGDSVQRTEGVVRSSYNPDGYFRSTPRSPARGTSLMLGKNV